MALWVLLGLLLTVLLQSLPVRWREPPRQRITCLWMGGLLGLLPLRIHCHGQPLPSTTLWVGNHAGRNELARSARQAVIQALELEDGSSNCQSSDSLSAAA